MMDDRTAANDYEAPIVPKVTVLQDIHINYSFYMYHVVYIYRECYIQIPRSLCKCTINYINRL